MNNLQELIEQLDSINDEITSLESKSRLITNKIIELKDGFEYYIRESSYGSSHWWKANNYKVAVMAMNSYNGENGSCYVYTDNPFNPVKEEDMYDNAWLSLDDLPKDKMPKRILNNRYIIGEIDY